jgi:hypothetical protein
MEELQRVHAVAREVQFMPTLQILHQLPKQMRPGRIVVDQQDAKHVRNFPQALIHS